jgi:hypothetical protein
MVRTAWIRARIALIRVAAFAWRSDPTLSARRIDCLECRGGVEVPMGPAFRMFGVMLCVAPLAVLGCASAQHDDAKLPPPLSGTYTLSAVGFEPGTIVEITFRQDRYTLIKNPCEAGPAGCGETGTFALRDNEGGTTIDLRRASDGNVTSLPIQLPAAAASSGSLMTSATHITSDEDPTAIVTAAQALIKCAAGLVSLARSFRLGNGAYSGGECPNPVGAAECEQNCKFPLHCETDPTNADRALCVDDCYSLCGSKKCMPSSTGVGYVGSKSWSCQYDYCGGDCTVSSHQACMPSPASTFYMCCGDQSVNVDSCSIPDSTTKCSPECDNNAGFSCVKGKCVDSCGGGCKDPSRCVLGRCV